MPSRHSLRLFAGVSLGDRGLGTGGGLVVGWALLIGLLVPCVVFAQAPGTVDRSFHPGSTTDGDVAALTLLPDDRAYLGGGFNVLAGTIRPQLARLLSDGSIDPGFNPGSGFSFQYTNGASTRSLQGIVSYAAAQDDGRVLVSGNFNHVDGMVRDHFARLNADGSVDTGFDPAAHAEGGLILRMLTLHGGHTLIWGRFTNLWDQPRYSLAMLQADGSLDRTFNPPIALRGQVPPNAVAVQNDGKILIGGFYSGIPTLDALFRLNLDGSLDAGFAQKAGASGISMIVVQRDDRILIGGSLSAPGLPNRNFARLEADGRIDFSFRPVPEPSGGSSLVTMIQSPDDSLLISGYWSAFHNGALGLFRLFPDGTIDRGFGVDGIVPVDNPIRSLQVRSDRRILAAGGFTLIGGAQRTSLALLNVDGSIDHQVNASNGIQRFVQQVTPLSNGQIFISGVLITNVQGTPVHGVARLNADGRIDRSFQPTLSPLLPGFGGDTFSTFGIAAAQGDGKVILGDLFRANNSFPFQYVSTSRLNRDGSLDTAYHMAVIQGVQQVPRVADLLLPLSDGKLLVAGKEMEAIDDQPVYRLGRLLEDGQLDTSFSLAPDFIDLVIEQNSYHLDSIQTLAPVPGGKMIVAGMVTSTDFRPHYRALVARLNPDGSLDPGFAIARFGLAFSFGASTAGFYAIGVQSDGKVIVSSSFSQVNGVMIQGTDPPYSPLVRFNVDGSLEEGFRPTVEGDGPTSLVEQPDGKLLIVGAFTRVNGSRRRGIARLNPDGSLDPLFDPGTGAANATTGGFFVPAVALQVDGKVLAGGLFPGFDGYPTDGLVRLFGGDQTLPLPARITALTVSPWAGEHFQARVDADRGQRVIIEAGPTIGGGPWAPLATNQSTGVPIWFTDLTARGTQRFYRAVTER